jgi:hypothetical protein
MTAWGAKADGRPCPGGSARRGGAVVDAKRDPDVAGGASTDFDLVDEGGVVGIGQLERGVACLENDDASTFGHECGSLGEAEDIAVEVQGFVELVRGHHEPQLADSEPGRAHDGCLTA